MRYTRYDINNKNKINFGVWFILIILLGTLIGIGIYKILIKSNLLNSTDNGGIGNSQNQEYIVSIIQCGVYKNKENADMQVKLLEDDCIPFVVQDEDKYKVMSGIYEQNIIDEEEKKISSKNISTFTIECKISGINSEDILKVQLIKGFVQIIQKFEQDSDIKAINTDKFKEWAEDLFKEYYNNQNDDDLNRLKNRIESIDSKYTREDAANDSVLIYDILVKCRDN